jgi:hypothetical protein
LLQGLHQPILLMAASPMLGGRLVHAEGEGLPGWQHGGTTRPWSCDTLWQWQRYQRDDGQGDQSSCSMRWRSVTAGVPVGMHWDAACERCLLLCLCGGRPDKCVSAEHGILSAQSATDLNRVWSEEPLPKSGCAAADEQCRQGEQPCMCECQTNAHSAAWLGPGCCPHFMCSASSCMPWMGLDMGCLVAASYLAGMAAEAGLCSMRTKVQGGCKLPRAEHRRAS